VLQTASADTKKTTARGNSKPQPAPDRLLAPPVPALGNQATLRLMRKCDCGGAPDCDCDMGDDKKKKETDSPRSGLHRSALSPQTPREAPPIVHETLRSPGHTLDPETQAFFEARFGQGLGHVRVHTDARASQSARAVNALAYTVGRDIVFAPGRFAPSANEGRRLLAHELAHVIQQRDVTGIPERVSDPSDPLERDADRMANHAMGAPATLPVRPFGSVGQPQMSRQTALQSLAAKVVQRQAASDPHADFQTALGLPVPDYDRAALALNGESQSDIEAEITALGQGSPHSSKLFKGAMRTMLLWPPPNRVADAIQKIDPASARQGRIEFFNESLATPDWRSAALALNGFNDGDIQTLLTSPAVTASQLTQLRDAAVQYMAGWNSRVVGPILNILQGRAAGEMGVMVGQQAKWQPSGPTGSTPTPTDFASWASAPAEAPFPALTSAVVLNCWEAVLLAAYKAGAINWTWIHNLYATPSAGWVAMMTRGARQTYTVGGPHPNMPNRGDLVFFNGLAHVAMATGSGSDVYTFWPPPNTPFTPGGTVDKVKISTIEALAAWMLTNFHSPPLVEFSNPAW
jgi:hypothetical protein